MYVYKTGVQQKLYALLTKVILLYHAENEVFILAYTLVSIYKYKSYQIVGL